MAWQRLVYLGSIDLQHNRITTLLGAAGQFDRMPFLTSLNLVSNTRLPDWADYSITGGGADFSGQPQGHNSLSSLHGLVLPAGFQRCAKSLATCVLSERPLVDRGRPRRRLIAASNNIVTVGIVVRSCLKTNVLVFSKATAETKLCSALLQSGPGLSTLVHVDARENPIARDGGCGLS